MTNAPYTNWNDISSRFGVVCSGVTTVGESDTFTISGTKSASLASVRNSISGSRVIFVPPSNNSNGIADTANIQAAIDNIQGVVGTAQGAGVVLLSGQYYITGPIKLGDVNTITKVLLHGVGATTITRVGVASSDYMLKIYSEPASGDVEVIKNITLQCQSKCRGILVTHVNKATICDLYIGHSVEVGIDLVECWWTNIRRISITDHDGFAFRGRSLNGCHLDSILCHGGKDDTWPSVTDTYCTTFDGTPWVTTSDERGGVYFWGNGSTITNMCFEANNYGTYPSLYCADGTNGNLFLNTRFEQDRNTSESILCHDVRNLCFQNIQAINSLAEERDSFMRCTGTCHGVKIDRLWGWSGVKDSGHIILLDGGVHKNVVCTECCTADHNIPTSGWIGTINSPTYITDWDDVFSS